MHPIIRAEEAKELLLNGNYITTVPYEISGAEQVKKWSSSIKPAGTRHVICRITVSMWNCRRKRAKTA